MQYFYWLLDKCLKYNPPGPLSYYYSPHFPVHFLIYYFIGSVLPHVHVHEETCYRYSMRPSVLEIYRHEHEGELSCILHKTQGFLMLYHDDPLPTVYINRKELYDFYYTAITLTTGYKYWYSHEYKKRKTTPART